MTEVRRSRRHQKSCGRERLHDRAEQERGEEGERADEDDHADQQHDEGRGVGAHRAQARGGDPLAGQRAGDREDEQDRDEAREHHRHAAQQVGEGDAEGAARCPAHWAGRSRCSRRTPSRCCWPARGRRTGSRRSPAGPLAKIDGLPNFVAIASAVVTSTASGVNSAPSEASLISRASIFLPRYSGVRPTISPPMKTASRTKTSIEYRPVPTPPKMTSLGRPGRTSARRRRGR